MAGISGRASEKDSDEAQAKKEGAIISARDLEERYGSHGEPNAGPMLIAFSQAYDAKPAAEKDHFRKLYSKWLSQGGEPSAELVQESEQTLSEFGPLDQFLSFDKCDIVPDWTRISSFPIRTWVGARHLEQSLVVLALRQSSENDLVGLEKSLRSLFRLSHDIAQTPMSVCLLIQVRSLRYVDQLIVDCARKDPHNPAKEALFRTLLGETQKVNLKRALEGEMFASWQVVDNLDSVLATDKSIPEKFKQEIRLAALVPGMRDAWRATDLDWLRTVRLGLDEHPYRWKMFEARLKALVPSTFAGVVEPEELIESLLHPTVISRNILTADLRAEAFRRSALMALGQIYHSDDVQLDPFSDRSLVLGRWSVRSVGPDGIAQPEGENGDDIAIRFAERPKG